LKKQQGFFGEIPRKKRPAREKKKTLKKPVLFKRRNDRTPRRMTIMLIPHSEKRTINFQVSPFTLAASFLLILMLMAGFLVFALRYSEKKIDSVVTSRELMETEASLDLMREEVKELLYTAGIFNRALNDTMESLDIDSNGEEFLSEAGGDWNAFFNIEESDSQALNEINDIKHLRTILDNSAANLDMIQSIFTKQTKLLTEIPSLWPVQGGVGYVSTNFGPHIHPFRNDWYMHRGIDISSSLGVPVLSTANGKVVETGYHATGYGYYIEIRHRYGFYTKYGHLQRIYVYEGQTVSQGDIIGTMGNTGLSTGPHLHYEVSIGTQLVDPSIYLDMGINRRKTFDNITTDLSGWTTDEE
jgi:murein DD-endopeptidase MepM/ murein hydrolase activator NlpD